MTLVYDFRYILNCTVLYVLYCTQPTVLYVLYCTGTKLFAVQFGI